MIYNHFVCSPFSNINLFKKKRINQPIFPFLFPYLQFLSCSCLSFIHIFFFVKLIEIATIYEKKGSKLKWYKTSLQKGYSNLFKTHLSALYPWYGLSCLAGSTQHWKKHGKLFMLFFSESFTLARLFVSSIWILKKGFIVFPWPLMVVSEYYVWNKKNTCVYFYVYIAWVVMYML